MFVAGLGVCLGRRGTGKIEIKGSKGQRGRKGPGEENGKGNWSTGQLSS